MFNRILFILILIISSVFIVNGANVEIISDVYSTETYFTYVFIFDKSESYQSFSFEKPKNSIVEFAVDEINNETLFYSVAGDFFIFKPITTNDKIFKIKFKSNDVVNNIFEKKSYESYVNFNIPINTLKYTLNFKENFGVIDKIYPRNYNFINNSYIWKIDNLEKDTIFLVNFKSVKSLNDIKKVVPNLKINNSLNSNNLKEDKISIYNDKYFILLVIVIILILILIVLFGKTLLGIISLKINRTINDSNNSSNNSNNINNINNVYDKNVEIVEDVKNINEIESSQKVNLSSKKLNDESSLKLNSKSKLSFEEYINKYLTENEKNVVNVVKENNGLSQYDILNYRRELTKSNLSKIISKLHVKKVLHRIKVGKVNKIYLGEVLEELLEFEK